MILKTLKLLLPFFQGDNVDCWMEIQEGKGPWASHVSGIVPIGSTLTLVVAIQDPSGEFDMMVRSCVAHDGVKPPLQLTDDRGCVLRPKMFSHFQKARTKDGRASVITYAHFNAFKFPDTMQVNIQCKVVICRHGCPKPCSSDTFEAMGIPNRLGLQHSPLVAKNVYPSGSGPVDAMKRQGTENDAETELNVQPPSEQQHTGLNPTKAQAYFPTNQVDAHHSHYATNSQSFPYGPRSYTGDDSDKAAGSRKIRSIHDDKELRVSNSYQAISRTDLAFAPNVTSDSVSVYSGRQSEGGRYGVCLSVPSFGALFASLGMFTVTAVLVAVVCGYHYRSHSKAMGFFLGRNQHQNTHASQEQTSGIVMQLNTFSRTKIQ